MKPVWYGPDGTFKINTNMNNKFTNKQEYLAYRSAWKAEYEKLSNEIRKYRGSWTHIGLKLKATDMLEERKLSKIEANRQYLEAKRLRLIAEGKARLEELISLH